MVNMFSKSCEYGIKAVVFIAQQSIQKKRVRLNDIAKEIDSPVAFTAKILQLLAKEKILNSVMGQSGGYEIELLKLNDITLLDIVNIIDGENVHSGCGLGFNECNELIPCPIHFEFVKIRSDLKLMLNTTTILTLATNLNSGLIHLKQLTKAN